MSKELELIAGALGETAYDADTEAEKVLAALSGHGYSIVPTNPGTCADDPTGTHRWMPTNYPWQWCPDCRLRKHDAFATAGGER